MFVELTFNFVELALQSSLGIMPFVEGEKRKGGGPKSHLVPALVL